MTDVIPINRASRLRHPSSFIATTRAIADSLDRTDATFVALAAAGALRVTVTQVRGGGTRHQLWRAVARFDDGQIDAEGSAPSVALRRLLRAVER